MEKINHYSVLLSETIKSLRIKPDGTYIDMTLGLGGHTKAIAKMLTTGKVIAIDQDINAIRKAKETLEEYSDKIIFVKSNFRNIDIVLKELGISKVDGILYDLGTSYYQLTSKERGFSFKGTKLDMRMDLDSTFNALNVLNEYSESDLKRIFFDYGDVKFAKDLAKEIILFRSTTPFENVLQLNTIISNFNTYNRKTNFNNIYQAIRIEVNDEIGALKESLEKALSFLKINGVISVISFHSYEDKTVKDIFNKYKNLSKETPFEIKKYFRTQKVIYPSLEEVNKNNPSRSAKLRNIIKINE